jgi:hypothetical protein
MNVTGQRRVNNAKINGEDIEPNKNYSVAMSDFIGNGGDGYNMFAEYEVSQEGLLTDTDSLSYFIKNDLNGKIPSEYKDLQGRINFVNGSIPSTTSNPTSNPTSITEEPSLNNQTSSWRYIQRKNSQGLSTGGIIAIIIPIVVALIAVAIIAMMCANKTAPIQKSQYESTNSNIELKI